MEGQFPRIPARIVCSVCNQEVVSGVGVFVIAGIAGVKFAHKGRCGFSLGVGVPPTKWGEIPILVSTLVSYEGLGMTLADAAEKVRWRYPDEKSE